MFMRVLIIVLLLNLFVNFFFFVDNVLYFLLMLLVMVNVFVGWSSWNVFFFMFLIVFLGCLWNCNSMSELGDMSMCFEKVFKVFKKKVKNLFV